MTTDRKKHLSILLIAFLSLWGCEEFVRREIGGFAGSYPFAEYWDIAASEPEVIAAIVALKKDNPSLQPPNQKELFFPRESTSDYWLRVNFYYPDTKEVVYTWTRPSDDPGVTTFALVGFGKINDSTDYRLINANFWYLANQWEIHKFKSTFVDKIKENIRIKRKSSI